MSVTMTEPSDLDDLREERSTAREAFEIATVAGDDRAADRAGAWYRDVSHEIAREKGASGRGRAAVDVHAGPGTRYSTKVHSGETAPRENFNS